MKKFILTGLILLPLSSLANDYYFKLEAGAAFTSKTASDVVSNKLKNANNFIGSFGAGKYINEDVRVGLSFMTGAEIIQSSSGEVNIKIPAFKDASEKHKISRQNLILKIEPDIYDFGYGKLFLSAGVGIARVRDNLTVIIDAAGKSNTYKAKSKDKVNPSILLGAGAGMFISENINIDFQYNFLHSGKTKSASLDIGTHKIDASKINVASHNITAGIRYSF